MINIRRTSNFFNGLGIDGNVRCDKDGEFMWDDFQKNYGYDPRWVQCKFLYSQHSLIALVQRGKAGVALKTYQNW